MSRREAAVFACICHAVSERDVLAAVDAGARSLDAVQAITGAASGCGMCGEHVEDLIDTRCGPCPLASLQVA